MWLRIALTEAAHVAARGKGTYLAAHHAQIRGRRGTQKAIGATRHDILIAYYHIVRDQGPYQDLGPDWNNRRRSTEQQTRRLVRQLERFGVNVTIEPIVVKTAGSPNTTETTTGASPRRHCRARGGRLIHTSDGIARSWVDRPLHPFGITERANGAGRISAAAGRCSRGGAAISERRRAPR